MLVNLKVSYTKTEGDDRLFAFGVVMDGEHKDRTVLIQRALVLKYNVEIGDTGRWQVSETNFDGTPLEKNRLLALFMANEPTKLSDTLEEKVDRLTEDVQDIKNRIDSIEE